MLDQCTQFCYNRNCQLKSHLFVKDLSVYALVGCLAHQLLILCLLQRIPFSGVVKL